VEMAGGINNFSPMIGNNASQLMKNLQQLIKANPAYLTSGIPTHLIQQMWKKEPEVATSQQQPKVMNNRAAEACFTQVFISFIICLTIFVVCS
jgi:hypothetical protein